MNFFQINHIISVGSVDGICTSTALLRLIGAGQTVGLEFCQAFTVDKVDLTKWEPNRMVAFVDLAINNRDPQMTADFVRRIREAGHQIMAVCDEHNASDWLTALGSFDGLLIQPVSQDAGNIKSSGALLMSLFGDNMDEHTRQLCAADAGDRMDFSTHFGGLVNQAVKSRIADDSRRVYLARYFAFNREPDETITGWIREYEEILRNHEEILAAKVDLGDGIVRVNATGRAVDMTTLMNTLYKSGARVVVCEGEMFNRSLNKKTVQIAFGTNDKSLDLLTIVKAAVPSASGFGQKVNVEPTDETAALAVIRASLK